mgnify:CR=1 FL=1
MNWAAEAINLTRTFGDFVAVNQVNFQVAPGEIFGFLGPNGSGKTTTIRMLCGLLPQTSGEGRVLGFDIATQSEQIKQRIGYMSQKFSLYNDLTVSENLEFYRHIYNVAGAAGKQRHRELLALAGLIRHEHVRTAELSEGWKQRLALVCALAHRPPILFLDEPTGGVDPEARRNFWDLINELAADGTTIFVTTHYMDEAEYCHRIGMMYSSNLIALDTPEQLKRTEISGQLFEIEAEDAPNNDWVDLALPIVRQQPYVTDASAYGARLRVSLSDAHIMPALLEKLSTLGLSQFSYSPVAPTLEDVFVRLVQRELAKG